MIGGQLKKKIDSASGPSSPKVTVPRIGTRLGFATYRTRTMVITSKINSFRRKPCHAASPHGQREGVR